MATAPTRRRLSANELARAGKVLTAEADLIVPVLLVDDVLTLTLTRIVRVAF